MKKLKLLMKSGIIIDVFYDEKNTDDFYEYYKLWTNENSEVLGFLNGCFKNSEIAGIIWESNEVLDHELQPILDHELQPILDHGFDYVNFS